MRSFTSFMLGVISGVVGVLAAQKVLELKSEPDSDSLTDQMSKQLERLEDRIQQKETAN